MTEAKPGQDGEKLGQLSPERQWIWMGPPLGWTRADQPADRAIRKLDE